MHVTRTITVARPRTEVYAFWRDFENLPRFMRYVESVETIDGNRSQGITRDGSKVPPFAVKLSGARRYVVTGSDAPVPECSG